MKMDKMKIVRHCESRFRAGRSNPFIWRDCFRQASAPFRAIVLAMTLLVFCLPLTAQDPISTEEFKKEEAAIEEMLDKMTNELFKSNYKFKTENGELPKNLPAVPLPDHETIKYRLHKIPTTIPMDYNQHVRGFIDLYANRKREMMQRMLGMSDIYFPGFEAALDKRNMPIELKHLAIVESALNPNAVSRVGATGIWQIMYTTARMLGLEINTFIDERRDPQLSTEAALNYLESMYNLYGDWLLVIASYNCGPGNVNKAIKKAGGSRDFWTVYKFLPAETRGYVPAFIAVNYVMKYHKEHGIVPMPVTASFNAVDTIMIYRNLSLKNIAEKLNMDLGELEMLNPSLKRKVVPAIEGGYALKLPLTKVALFEEKRFEIFSETEEQVKAIAATSSLPSGSVTKYSSENNTRIYYTVKENETLDMIAGWFDVDLNKLRNWNNIFGNVVNVGQQLMMMVPRDKSAFYEALDTMTAENKAVIWKEKKAEMEALALKNAASASPSKEESETVAGGYKIVTRKIPYTVKSGDNLSVIAARYKCTVDNLREWNNLRTSKLFIGQKLYVYQKQKVKIPDAAPVQSTAKDSSLQIKASDGTHPAGYDSTCNCIYYEVKSGDTLWKISQQYPGQTVDKLKKANGITNGIELKPGMRIKIEI
jgi:membrane-bound lytic murein transglycosylase D